MRYRIYDVVAEHDVVVDTEAALGRWEERTRPDGVSLATGSQWNHETLYRGKRGKYYLERVSRWQGSRSWAEWVTEREAACWLLVNGYELPDDLEGLADEILE